VKRRLTIDWQLESKKGQALEVDSVPIVSIPGYFKDSGTSIACSRIDRTILAETTLDQLMDKLRHIYHPSLKEGLMITFHRGEEGLPVRLTMRDPPRYAANTPSVMVNTKVCQRDVAICAYVSADDLPELSAGIHVCAFGRVVDQIETKQFAPRLYGSVELGDEWELGKNKTEVTDDLWPQAMIEIRRICQPVIRAAAEQATAVRIAELVMDVENTLNDGLRGDLRRPGQASRSRHTGPHERFNETGDGEPFDAWLDEPDDEQDESGFEIDHDSKAPLVAVHPVTMPDEEFCKLEPWPSGWIVKVNKNHPWWIDYCQESFGIRGHDSSRLTAGIINCIAAHSTTNEVVLKALPWLNGAAQEDRYSLVASRLWASYLKTRSLPGERHTI
jgi:hypothetical protein